MLKSYLLVTWKSVLGSCILHYSYGERVCRQETTAINIVIESADLPIPVSTESFSASSGNKQQLHMFFISYTNYIKMTSQSIWVDWYQVI